jgi:hypothetical protein
MSSPGTALDSAPGLGPKEGDAMRIVHLLVLAVSLLAAGAAPGLAREDPLAAFPALRATTTLHLSECIISDLLTKFRIRSGIRLRGAGRGVDTLSAGLFARAARIHDVLESIPVLYPQLEWSRKERILLLDNFPSPPYISSLNRSRTPQTPDEKHFFKLGLQFVEKFRQLKRIHRDRLTHASGAPFMALSFDMIPLVRGMLRARLAASKDGLPIQESDIESCHVRFESKPRDGYRKYTLQIWNERGSMGLSFNDFKPLPIPVVRPRDVQAETAERAKVVEKDARFARPITLRLRNADVATILVTISRKSGISVLYDGESRHPGMLDVAIVGQPLKRALDQLGRKFEFEWERSKSGILVVQKGKYEPWRIARAKFGGHADRVMKEFSHLSEAERLRAGGSFALDGLSPDLREAIIGVFAHGPTGFSPADMRGSVVEVSITRQRTGDIRYNLQANLRDGRRHGISFGE